jgi:hypothetical protein
MQPIKGLIVGLIVILQGAMGVLFLVSGLFKMFHWREFVVGLLHIPYVRRPWNSIIGVFLPMLELFAGFGIWENWIYAKILGLFMLFCFSLVALIAIKHRQAVPCNCFALDGGAILSVHTIYRNAFLMAITLMSLYSPGVVNLFLTPIYSVAFLLICLIIRQAVVNQTKLSSLRGDGAL